MGPAHRGFLALFSCFFGCCLVGILPLHPVDLKEMTSELVPRRKSFAAMVALVLEEANVVDQHMLENRALVDHVFF